MRNLEQFIVPWVYKSEPYSSKHSDFAWKNPQIARMMSNENPHPPSQKILDAIFEAAKQGQFYPHSGEELRRKLSEKVGLTPNNVLLGNGSTDIIDIVVHTFVEAGDEVIISVPTFSMYQSRVNIAGGKPRQIPLTKDFNLDISAIKKALNSRTKLIFVCSPNNPTGNQISLEDLKAILELGYPTFFDEAYIEFEDVPVTRVGMIRDFPLLMVNRTFSKAYGIAGLRLGYLFSEETLSNYFNRVRLPWNVNLLAIAAAIAALDDEEGVSRKRDSILTERNILFEKLNSIPGIRAIPSEGNFILIDATSLGLSSAAISQRMIERGYFIRPLDSHSGAEGFVRVTVSSTKDNQGFFNSFKDFVLETTS
jgi:histidinol-phosphate aminotransferase